MIQEGQCWVIDDVRYLGGSFMPRRVRSVSPSRIANALINQ